MEDTLCTTSHVSKRKVRQRHASSFIFQRRLFPEYITGRTILGKIHCSNATYSSRARTRRGVHPRALMFVHELCRGGTTPTAVLLDSLLEVIVVVEPDLSLSLLLFGLPPLLLLRGRLPFPVLPIFLALLVVSAHREKRPRAATARPQESCRGFETFDLTNKKQRTAGGGGGGNATTIVTVTTAAATRGTFFALGAGIPNHRLQSPLRPAESTLARNHRAPPSAGPKLVAFHRANWFPAPSCRWGTRPARGPGSCRRGGAGTGAANAPSPGVGCPSCTWCISSWRRSWRRCTPSTATPSVCRCRANRRQRTKHTRQHVRQKRWDNIFIRTFIARTTRGETPHPK